MIFKKRYRYRFGDVDHAGIAYYPSFFHYFHCCFEDWWGEGLCMPYHEVLRQGRIGLPAVKVDCEFQDVVRYGDEPDLHLGILALGKSSVSFGYWMTHAGREGALCRAKITTVATDLRSYRPVPLPLDWRQAFRPYLISEKEFPAGRAAGEDEQPC